MGIKKRGLEANERRRDPTCASFMIMVISFVMRLVLRQRRQVLDLIPMLASLVYPRFQGKAMSANFATTVPEGRSEDLAQRRSYKPGLYHNFGESVVLAKGLSSRCCHKGCRFPRVWLKVTLFVSLSSEMASMRAFGQGFSRRAV